MYQYHICWSRFIIYRIIIDPHNEQFPVGLIPQQVEHRPERSGFASRSDLPRSYNGSVKKKKKLRGSHTSNHVSTRSSNTWPSCIDIISIAYVFKHFGYTMVVLSTEDVSGKMKITWDKRLWCFCLDHKGNWKCFVLCWAVLFQILTFFWTSGTYWFHSGSLLEILAT